MDTKEAEDQGVVRVLPQERGRGSWTVLAWFAVIGSAPVGLWFGPEWAAYAVLLGLFLRLMQ